MDVNTINKNITGEKELAIRKNLAGKTLYAALFNLLLPLLLVIWAFTAGVNVELPMIDSPLLGITLAFTGVLMVIAGMRDIIKWGKGLPMNAYPPENYVTCGIFGLIPHPIYTGAVISFAGASIFLGSPAGFWLVTPVLALSCAALVYGYEKEDIKSRFGEVKMSCKIRLPENSKESAAIWDYISVYTLVFLSWFILYELVCLIGTNQRSISTFMSFEYSIPVMEWTEIIYLLTYPFVLFVPAVLKRKDHLRNFSVTALTATIAGILLQIFLPFTAPPREFVPQSFPGHLLILERQMDSAAAAFPSFHVIWAFIAAYFYSFRFRKKTLWYITALILSLSCITAGMHSIADLAAGYLTFLFAVNAGRVAGLLTRIAEKIANSWHEWNFKRFRVLNHGIYVGIGSAVGYLIISSVTGAEYNAAIFYVAIIIVVFAGLWAQLIEGSPKLSRPYGFYGGLLGAAAGIITISRFFDLNTGLLLGGYALAAPWIQISGRFRCLIQGCCHGREIRSDYGIKYHHPRSRVCRLSELKNKPLHPTQLYSMLSNLVTGLFLLRLWYENVSPEFIAGIYLILNGLSRFAEESYRGEPQTPVFYGLRLYQWMAILCLVAGAVLTTLQSHTIKPEIHTGFEQILYALLTGIITFFSMGVDFPRSDKRFARLA